MSRGLDDFGWIEELYLMGATTNTIAKMTKLPQEKVQHIIYQIEKNRDTLRGFKVGDKNGQHKS